MNAVTATTQGASMLRRWGTAGRLNNNNASANVSAVILTDQRLKVSPKSTANGKTVSSQWEYTEDLQEGQ